MFERTYIVINRRSAIGLIVLFVVSGIRQSQTAGSHLEQQQQKNNTNNNHVIIVKSFNDSNMNCPIDPDIRCDRLDAECLRCNYNTSCHYGRDLNVTCIVPEGVSCVGDRTVQRQMNCRYCYQTERSQQTCVQRGNCNSVNDQWYRTNCSVHSYVYCLGNRSFTRNIKCNWTQGYRWSSALLISLLLGGFGGDRFYLGHWQEGIGKLFSFGGLGVWTIIDVVLISLHYLGPADGSLYI